jgi:hypothetical protein
MTRRESEREEEKENEHKVNIDLSIETLEVLIFEAEPADE